MIKSHKDQHYVPLCYLKAWVDPRPPINQTPYIWIFPHQAGLGWPNLEITVSPSPKQLLFIIHNKERKQFMEPVQYIDIEESLVHEFNRRTRAYSKSEIVVNQNYTNPHWFFNDNLKE